MKDKNGATFTLWIIIGAVLAILFVIVYGNFQVSLAQNLFGSANDQIDSAKDHDGDGLITFEDECPCVRGSQAYNGCPAAATDQQREDRSCLG